MPVRQVPLGLTTLWARQPAGLLYVEFADDFSDEDDVAVASDLVV